MTKIKLFSKTSVNFGVILNVTIFIIQIAGILKTEMNPGIAQGDVAPFFLSFSYQVTKTFWLVVLARIVTSHSEKIQKMIIVAHYH